MSALDIVLAILMPPAAVALRYGFSKQFFINLILTLLAWIPGVIHALLVLRK